MDVPNEPPIKRRKVENIICLETTETLEDDENFYIIVKADGTYVIETRLAPIKQILQCETLQMLGTNCWMDEEGRYRSWANENALAYFLYLGLGYDRVLYDSLVGTILFCKTNAQREALPLGKSVCSKILEMLHDYNENSSSKVGDLWIESFYKHPNDSIVNVNFGLMQTIVPESCRGHGPEGIATMGSMAFMVYDAEYLSIIRTCSESMVEARAGLFLSRGYIPWVYKNLKAEIRMVLDGPRLLLVKK